MITLCIPSRGRPQRFRKMLESAKATAKGPFEVCVWLDTDEPRREQYPSDPYVRYGTGPREYDDDGVLTTSSLWDHAWDMATGDIAFLGGDDLVFHTPGWDVAIEEAMASFGDRIGMVYADTGEQRHEPWNPCVSREWIDVVGYFTPPGYPGWFADTHVWNLAASIDRVIYLPDVFIENSKGFTDPTVVDGQAARAQAGGYWALRNRFNSPRAVAERDEQAARLNAAMMWPQPFVPSPTPKWFQAARYRPQRNEDTLVVVHCYDGDREQVENFLPLYLHHGCPVLILSPEDSPVVIDAPGVECRSAGKRGYFGQDSLDRERLHLQIVLEYPQRYFLLNDADSFCLSPKIPKYLYLESEDTFWSNEVKEGRPHPSPYPKLGLHPPYFAERSVIERILAVGPIEAHPITPFLDWFLLAAICEAGLKHRSYPDGRSFPAWRHGWFPGTVEMGHDYQHVELEEGGKDGGARMAALAEQGTVMIHSVKHKRVADLLVAAHERFTVGKTPPSISFLVPFREDSSGTRTRTWRWLERYYRETVPEAEIVIGNYEGELYSKSAAVNDAASRATGDIFVILDADTLIDPEHIRNAAASIKQASHPIWFIPHSRAYRLTAQRSEELMNIDPRVEGVPLEAPARSQIEDSIENAPGFVQVISRKAFFKVGGMDPRFIGWGGEDACFVRAVDTLAAKSQRLPGHVLHLWHERPGAGSSRTRIWDGQVLEGGRANRELIQAYKAAVNDARDMRLLVQEGLRAGATRTSPSVPTSTLSSTE